MTNELTIRVQSAAIPPLVWNKDEVEKNVNEMLAEYTGRVYTVDDVAKAKEDRAKVNSWKTKLGEALTAARKTYLGPLEEPGKDIKAMQEKISKIVSNIDEQTSAFEQAEKDEKRSSLVLAYRDNIGWVESLIPFDRIFDPKWLNKSCSLSKAKKELLQKIEDVKSDLATIQRVCGEDIEPCTTEYQKNLNLNEAINEHDRRYKSREDQRKAEAARIAEEKAIAAAPVIAQLTTEQREMKAKAAAASDAKMFITPEGRLDFEAMQRAQSAAQDATSAPARKRYYFWVDFTPQDITWFRQAAKERGFKFGSSK